MHAPAPSRAHADSSAPQAPQVFHASHTHASTSLQVHVVGVGLAAVVDPVLVLRDGSARIPLRIVAQDDHALTAEGQLPVALTDADLELASAAGPLPPVRLSSKDQVLGAPLSHLPSGYFVDPDTAYRPKDFAFFCNTVPTATPNVWRRLFHLIYTRSLQRGEPAGQTEFGHAWTSRPDIASSWQTDTHAFSAGATLWDATQIYAPTLIQRGGTTYMFYTGLDLAGNESIGYTSTTLLDTTNTLWGDRTQVLNTLEKRPAWVAPPGDGFRGSMRDPFVMEDPEHPGQLLMYYVAGNTNDRTQSPPTAFYRNAVGVARSQPGTLNAWDDLGYFRSTDYDHARTGNDESPHLFADPAHTWPSQSSAATWRLVFTDGPAPGATSINICLKGMGTSLGDTTLANWQFPPTRLFAYLHQDSTVFGWEATELLRVPNGDYLGAYDDLGIAISPVSWTGSNFNLGPVIVAGVGGPPRTDAQLRFALAELVPGRHQVGFRIDLPAPMHATVTVYDVTGRALRTLVARELPAGPTTLTWDGRDRNGSVLTTGMYFARLACAAGVRSIRVPVLR